MTEEVNNIIVPRTINDVLMARIDRLEEKTRNLVKVASVIGRSFFYRVLSEVAGFVDDMDERLSPSEKDANFAGKKEEGRSGVSL